MQVEGQYGRLNMAQKEGGTGSNLIQQKTMLLTTRRIITKVLGEGQQNKEVNRIKWSSGQQNKVVKWSTE